MPNPTPTEKRYAVCIGINQYAPSSALGALRFAEADAQAIYDLLGQVGFAADDRVLLLGEAATLEAINKAMAEMILDRPHEDDLVVLYFAGHSVPLTLQNHHPSSGREAHSEVFLASYDFDREKIGQSRAFRKQQALGIERLRKDFFEGEGSRKRLFLFDSCYSGDFSGPRYRGDTDPVQGYMHYMLDCSSTGRVALASCLPLQQAVEEIPLGHGRFTYHLLQALSGKAPDAQRADGCITVNTLFEYLATQLPADQRPALSGVQHDTFTLVCYPKSEETRHAEAPPSRESQRAEKERRLRAMLADHRSFINDRLASFVGRTTELTEIQQRITERLQTGGYVTITGQAGQGKSSVIAKLVETYGTEQVAFHFIPFNPGPDHQVELLRNVMARLILKYDLSDLYVASESRPALRGYFPRVLADLVEKNGQEVIFIDGLDQLREDSDGERDLSFLPNDLPRGVVFVLGTRPDDALRPLELLKPHDEYRLPNLSRQDFDHILAHRGVRLERGLADTFYGAMQENALYLDLVAKELKELAEDEAVMPATLVKHIADNPNNLFSLSMMRLKRKERQWRQVTKPLLGALLVACEPLSSEHLRHLLAVEDDELREAIERLGGLLARDGQHRYYLFHLKLQEYLQQSEQPGEKDYIFARDEEQRWHNTLALWCTQGDLLTMWRDVRQDKIEQGRREYARRHYITHLYHARAWRQLFEVLDTVQFGRAKIGYDPGMRSYVQDLDLGRRAAAREEWTLEEGIALLPHLWRYTLLRCSLTSRADTYTPEMFELLLWLKHESEALGLAELLTKPAYKASIFLLIGKWLEREPSRRREGLQLFLRAQEVVPSGEEYEQIAKTLGEISCELASLQKWERAEAVASIIEHGRVKAETLRIVGKAMIQQQHWEYVQGIISSIDEQWIKDKMSVELGMALIEAQQWDDVKQVAQSLRTESERADLLRTLGIALAQAQQWEQVEAVVTSLQDVADRAIVLRELGKALDQARRWTQAATTWNRVRACAHRIGDNALKIQVLQELGSVLTQAGRQERAEVIWEDVLALAYTRKAGQRQTMIWQGLCKVLAQTGQWERAEILIRSLQEERDSTPVLSALGMALAQAGQWERAEVLRHESLVFHAFKLNGMEAEMLVKILAQAGEWERAEAIARSLQYEMDRAPIWRALVDALVQAGEWERAEAFARSLQDEVNSALVLHALGTALTKAREWSAPRPSPARFRMKWTALWSRRKSGNEPR